MKKEEIIKDRERVVSEIVRLNGFTEEYVYNLQFDLGCKYVEKLLGDWGMKDIRPAALLITQNPKYWAWWRNQWKIMDETLIRKFKVIDGFKSASKQQLEKAYVLSHSKICAHPSAEITKVLHQNKVKSNN